MQDIQENIESEPEWDVPPKEFQEVILTILKQGHKNRDQGFRDEFPEEVKEGLRRMEDPDDDWVPPGWEKDV